MVENGKILKGTPLFRLNEVLGDAATVVVYAGDVLDVCGACEKKIGAGDSIVDDLSEQMVKHTDKPSAKVVLKTSQIRHLIDIMLSEPKPMVLPEAAVTGAAFTPAMEPYEERSKEELHDEAARRGLPRSGSKDELMAVLRDDDKAKAEGAPAYEDWSKADLQEEAGKRGLPKSGTKEDLIAALRENDAAL